MKKVLIILCLFLSSCGLHRSEAIMTDYDFKLAVIAGGTEDSEIIYYDGNYQEAGRIRLDRYFVNYGWTQFRKPVFHDGYAYLSPSRARVANYEILRMNLANGSIDYIPIETFPVEDLFLNDEKLVVIQTGTNGGLPFKRSEIPFDGSQGKVTRYSEQDLPGIYYRIPEGWIRFITTPVQKMILYDPDFNTMDEIVLGTWSHSNTEAEKDASFDAYLYDSVYMNSTLYVPVQQALWEWEESDGVWHTTQLKGYKFGLMKIKTDPLRYEIVMNENILCEDIEQLDETRIIMTGCDRQTDQIVTEDGTYYDWSNSQRQFFVFDTVTEEFSPVLKGWQPRSVQRSKDVLYSIGLNNRIHVMDPKTLEDITVIEPALDDPYTLSLLLPSDTYGE